MKRRLKKIPPDMIKWMMQLPKEEGIRLMERVKQRLYLETDLVLEQAFKEKILSKEEYEKSYKARFYDDFGMDSFVQYLEAVMGDKKVDCFVTENERMLNIKEKLKEKFGLRIASPKEIIEDDAKK